MECKFCSKKFSRKRECDRHMRQKHGFDSVAEKKKEKAASREPALPFNFQHDVERNGFSCFHCSRVFISATERDRHELSHFDLRPHACSQCGKMFKKHVHRKLHEKHCGATVNTDQSGTSRYEGCGIQEDESSLNLEKSTLRGVAKMYTLMFSNSEEDLFPRLKNSMISVFQKLTEVQQDDRNV